MEDFGKVRKLLGMEIKRDMSKGMLHIGQLSYLKKVVSRYSMSHCKWVTTPLAPHFKLSSDDCPKNEDEEKKMNGTPYTSDTGSLMYGMVCTRPDIGYSSSLVTRLVSNPSKSIVAFSTTKAEYVTLREVLKEDKWLKGFVKKLWLWGGGYCF